MRRGIGIPSWSGCWVSMSHKKECYNMQISKAKAAKAPAGLPLRRPIKKYSFMLVPLE